MNNAKIAGFVIRALVEEGVIFVRTEDGVEVKIASRNRGLEIIPSYPNEFTVITTCNGPACFISSDSTISTKRPPGVKLEKNKRRHR